MAILGEIVGVLQLGAILIITFVVAVAIYRTHFHPLADYPGPRLWALSRIPMAYNLLRGRLPYRISELHEQYGPVVRLAPAELSYTDDAWNDIYAKPVGKPQLRKDLLQFLLPSTGYKGLLFEDNDIEHSRMRRNFSHAFSDKSMREQEPIINKYIIQLIHRLHENVNKPVDLVNWYNFCTFDVIGDLVFGESFDCLHTSKLHVWISFLFQWVAGVTLLGMAQRFWPLAPILLSLSLIPRHMQEAEEKHRLITKVKLARRMAISESRPDFMTHVFKSMGNPDGIKYGEILETATVLLAAGSETTATLLCGATYYLLSNPSTLAKPTYEIRQAFENEDEICMATVQKLEYQLAVLNEALRLFPPVSGNLRRVTPDEGCMINGRFVPGNTNVAVDLYAAGHSSRNFIRPKEFIPERWLADAGPEFKNDKRKVVQPFSYGPRGCIGKSLAYMEMRLILARALWAFDLQLCQESKGWIHGMKVYAFFEKPQLMVKLSPARRGIFVAEDYSL